jgi:hypothetical protein
VHASFFGSVRESSSAARVLFGSLLIAVLSSIASVAQGGPPMITDDPETPGDGKWEINVASTLAQHAGERAWDVPLLDINYGWGDHVQLKLEGAFALLEKRGDGCIAGLGDALAGIKWRFLDEENAGVSMSIYPQVEWSLAHASVRRGLIEKGTHILLPIEASRQIGWLLLDAEVGDSIDLRGGDEWFYGFIAGFQLNKKLELFTELHGVNKFDGHGSELTVNFGASQKLIEHVTLLMSIGHDVRAVDGESRRLIAYLGVGLEF